MLLIWSALSAGQKHHHWSPSVAFEDVWSTKGCVFLFHVIHHQFSMCHLLVPLGTRFDHLFFYNPLVPSLEKSSQNIIQLRSSSSSPVESCRPPRKETCWTTRCGAVHGSVAVELGWLHVMLVSISCMFWRLFDIFQVLWMRVFHILSFSTFSVPVSSFRPKTLAFVGPRSIGHRMPHALSGRHHRPKGLSGPWPRHIFFAEKKHGVFLRNLMI